MIGSWAALVACTAVLGALLKIDTGLTAGFALRAPAGGG
jgi:hypothetical protein